MIVAEKSVSKSGLPERHTRKSTRLHKGSKAMSTGKEGMAQFKLLVEILCTHSHIWTQDNYMYDSSMLGTQCFSLACTMLSIMIEW